MFFFFLLIQGCLSMVFIYVACFLHWTCQDLSMLIQVALVYYYCHLVCVLLCDYIKFLLVILVVSHCFLIKHGVGNILVYVYLGKMEDFLQSSGSLNLYLISIEIFYNLPVLS